MDQWEMIAYAVLLTINISVLLLLVAHMRKFNRLNRTFLTVVQNVQAYLDAVMDDETEDEMKDTAGFREPQRRSALNTREAEELLGNVLGEIFS